MVISFSSPKPRARLLEGKRVYTARAHRRKQFIDVPWGTALKDWANEGRTKPKIADVIIFEVGHVSAKQLPQWQSWSGFDDMEEWIEEIKRLNRWKDVLPTDKFCLYMVQKWNSFFKPGSST